MSSSAREAPVSNDTNSDDLLEPLLDHQPPLVNDDNGKDIIFPKWLTVWRSPNQPKARMNHNVFLNLLLSVMYGIGYSLWMGTVFVAYLKRLAHDHNGPVGDIEAINGMAVLFAALPVGYLADRVGRSTVISAGGILYICTAALHFVLLIWIGVDETQLSKEKSRMAFWLLATVMALWGVGGGIVSGPTQALYADSTRAGERSVYFFYQFAAYVLSSAIGPILSIVLFQTLGDDWDLYHLRAVMFVGLGLSAANAFIMFFFDDNKALDECEEQGEISTRTEDKEPNGEHEKELNGQIDGQRNGEIADNSPSSNEDANDEEAAPEAEGVANENEANERMKQRRKWIPYFLFASSLTVSLGSGMTIKFFPLFFKDEVGMSPTQVQIVYSILPFVMTVITKGVTKVSATIGRVQATIVSVLMGTSCLYAMVFFKTYLDNHPFVLVPVYVVRTALVNASYPIRESILMDFVPKNQRARWKSLQSISRFGWCGSAAVGGWLADRWDYTFTFFITATIQTCSVFFYALLLPLVPRKEGER